MDHLNIINPKKYHNNWMLVLSHNKKKIPKVLVCAFRGFLNLRGFGPESNIWIIVFIHEIIKEIPKGSALRDFLKEDKDGEGSE
jgi:hypothetical protein